VEDAVFWSQEKLGQWHTLKQCYQACTEVATLDQKKDQQRHSVRQEMLQLLQALLNEHITLRDFNTVFQQQTHKTWDVFGMRGLSGGMFLNKLVKYIPEHELLAQQLCVSLRLPRDTSQGQRCMRICMSFLEQAIAAGQGTRGQLQPARLPFFLSAWWHLQDPVRWPLFHMSTRRILLEEDKTDIQLQNPVNSYFIFQTRFLALAEELTLSSWELEHLITWVDQQKEQEGTCTKVVVALPSTWLPSVDIQSKTLEQLMLPATSPQPSHIKPEVSETPSAQESKRFYPSHTLWLLAKLGQKVGCTIWIAVENHRHRWQGEHLGDLSTSSPPRIGNTILQHMLSSVDIIWFQEQTLVAAYKIEYTDDLSISLQCLSDLTIFFRNQAVPFYCVASRTSFVNHQYIHGREQELREQCTWILRETLFRHQRSILRWAASPAIIQDLIQHAGELIRPTEHISVEESMQATSRYDKRS
jgi:hypothetical protein